MSKHGSNSGSKSKSDVAVLVDIDVAAEAWEESGFDLTGLCQELAAVTLGGLEQDRLPAAQSYEISVLLCDDGRIRELNRDHRGQDKPTNVLSFPADFALTDPQNLSILLGDIALSYDTLKNEADHQNKSLSDHFSHLFVHGLLHLVGYDHEDEDAALTMESLETKILTSFGVADPYQPSRDRAAL